MESCHPAGGKGCDLPDDCEAIVKDEIFQGVCSGRKAARTCWRTVDCHACVQERVDLAAELSKVAAWGSLRS